jgi:hypothetical protein
LAELSKTNIPNVKNILSNLDSSDKNGERPRDNNLNTLESSAKYNKVGEELLELIFPSEKLSQHAWLAN